MTGKNKPGLFGITHSNRDFSQVETWGKNQFNSSLPASLAAFVSRQGLENIYLRLDKNFKVIHGKVSSTTLFGIEPTDDNLFFGFESPFTPYQQLLIGHIPRVDLVTQHRGNGSCLKGIEIKLTALPDNSTCHLTENQLRVSKLI